MCHFFMIGIGALSCAIFDPLRIPCWLSITHDIYSIYKGVREAISETVDPGLQDESQPAVS